jgi:2-keto-4-pentenoate hydratase/2-oxohepta-3-ene-1,7-dioic acid hydratase in catechol pathway
MRLIRFGDSGAEKPGIQLGDGTRLDVSSAVTDYNEAFFSKDGIKPLREWLKQHGSTAPKVPLSVRLGPPVSRPSKIVCIGLNYKAHAEESKKEVPKEPVIFMKATSSLSGPFDPVIIPRNSLKLDWEVELAFVIGKRASYVDPEQALAHVAGYVLLNDYSERSFQLERAGQWVKGKSADTFCPLGPFLATADEIQNPNALNLWLKVNGSMRQNSNTSDMIFHVPYLISYISQFMSLLPGDIVSTGTPSGVGSGMTPPTFLRAGDIVELGMDGLGESRQGIAGPV